MGNTISTGRPSKWSLIKLHEFCKSEERVIKYLMENKTLPETMTCPNCKSDMKLCGARWRCWATVKSKKGTFRCNTEVSARAHTWFARSKLTVPKIMLMTYMMLHNYQLSEIEFELDINKSTLTHWISFIRDELTNWAMEKSEKLGGEGVVVEIDESMFGRRKYYRGHRTNGQWVFGIFEKGSGRIFMTPVKDRTRETLLKIIIENVKPGTTIISDCWKSYDTLGQEGYTHLSVNHSIHFKDPDTGAHTNGIESSWRHAKRFMPHYCRKKRLYVGYLSHYMFVRHCKFANRDILDEFLSYIAGTVFFPDGEEDTGEEVLSEFEEDGEEA